MPKEAPHSTRSTGHFAAGNRQQPQLFTAELRAAFGSLRQSSSTAEPTRVPLSGRGTVVRRTGDTASGIAADPVPTRCCLVADTRASRGVEIVDGATVCVAVVGSRTEAELLAGILRSHGLKAAVSADDAGGQYPQMQIDGVRVLVAPSDEASARRLLAATDDLAEPDGGS